MVVDWGASGAAGADADADADGSVEAVASDEAAADADASADADADAPGSIEPDGAGDAAKTATTGTSPMARHGDDGPDAEPVAVATASSPASVTDGPRAGRSARLVRNVENERMRVRPRL